FVQTTTHSLYFIPTSHPLCSTFVPYTTLFRSRQADDAWVKFQNKCDKTVQKRLTFRYLYLGTFVFKNGFSLLIIPRAVIRKNITDRKSTRLNSSHVSNSYAVFCLKKDTKKKQ